MKRINSGKIFKTVICTVALFAMAVSCTQFFRLTDGEQIEENGGGHTHVFAPDWTGDETYHWHICTVCSAIDDTTKSAHTWDSGTVTIEPTATSEGLITYKCTVCKKTRDSSLPPKHDHTFATEWKSDETYHWHICTVCSVIDDTTKSAHTWDGGTVTIEPTATSEGVRTYKCSVCQKEKTESVEKLSLLDNKVIGGKTIGKTGEVVVIPAGETATVHMTDDSAWSGYAASSDSDCKGVFIKDRKVMLSPFAMGKYQVTQELYKAVLENDNECNATPSELSSDPADGEAQEKRPVEKVSWYDAVYFCNVLTKLTMSEADCVYTITGITRTTNGKKSIVSATVTQDFTKKGYRLPTEAEWEFAARGGDLSREEWKYSYAGSQTGKAPASFTSSPYNDDALEAYAWYINNSGSSNSDNKTHEVGTKKANTLGLYDMSGNVWEWCWDCYGDITVETVTDPRGPVSGSFRLIRGGDWGSKAYGCAVSFRNSLQPGYCFYDLGFRLARSL